ncbi:MAG: cell division ATP-binding protein FtsE [Clostridiales bacterium]|nr:cell division ATP-binding protein FtsE [Clostridiales bacterium]
MIDFIDVEKTYKSGVEALKGVSFTIEDGEFVFVIGKSGSGKSTLLKCITCEETPTAGKVTIDNFDISHMSRALVPVLRRRIGMIYQDFRLIETKTVAENVAFAGEIIGVPKQNLMNTVLICLSVVGLKDKADCYPQELSGGEQQRVAIARAMVNNPSLIVADEPTGNLDPETSEAIMAMLLEINRNGGTTIIICTHDSAMVDRMKQRVIEIDDGLVARDEKRSGYKGDGADHEAYMPHAARTSSYGGSSSGVAFGDDEEYGDSYDDPGYGSEPVPDHNGGLLFGEEKASDKVVNIVEETVISAEPAEKKMTDIEDLPEETVEEETAEQEPEVKITEINIPEERVVSFGDEKPEAAPVIPMDQADSQKEADPDLDEGGLEFPADEDSDSRDSKRELKRKLREAKRQEKLDKKKKSRGADFQAGSDIDIFPEDEE